MSKLLLNELSCQFNFLTGTMSIFKTELSYALWTNYTIVFCKTTEQRSTVYMSPCTDKITNTKYQHLLISVWGHGMFLNHSVIIWQLKNTLVKINIIITVNLQVWNHQPTPQLVSYGHCISVIQSEIQEVSSVLVLALTGNWMLVMAICYIFLFTVAAIYLERL